LPGIRADDEEILLPDLRSDRVFVSCSSFVIIRVSHKRDHEIYIRHTKVHVMIRGGKRLRTVCCRSPLIVSLR
jgi:hypothetical protein